MDRAKFIEEAGGIFTSNRDYGNLGSDGKYELFWSFFLDKEYGWVRSVYGDIPIERLYRNGHSIEHIVPKGQARDLLRAKGRSEEVIKGARTNPLNFMAAYNDLNSKRGSREFDTEDDAATRNFRIPLNPAAEIQTGLDFEGEWVIPSRTQGDVARCVLYMMLVYELDGLYEEDIDQMRRWVLIDPPRDWEIAFNNWVFERLGIRNPLITNDLDLLKSILESPDLFDSILAPVPPLPEPPEIELPQGLKHGYAVLVGQVESFRRDSDNTPHMLFRVRDNDNSWEGSINVQSSFNVSVDPQAGIPKNNLLVYVNEDLQHPVTDTITNSNYQPGINYVTRGINTGALDYIRGNLFDPKDMTIMPAAEAGLNNDLFERLEAILTEAKDREATVYAFGEPYRNGRGIHNIHMNQGSVIERFKSTDGIWQDGGLLIEFPERWVAVFTAFQSQCWHTDDTTGQANQDGRCSRFSQGGVVDDRDGVAIGGYVRIISALVNPDGSDAGNEQVTLINLGEESVDLTDWQIVDKLDRVEKLEGTITGNGSKVITLSGEGAILGNSGSTITLVDAEQLRVHGVSYTRNQARAQGSKITFI